MSSAIITVENLGKCYRIQHQSRERYTALRDVLTNKVKGLFRPQTSDLRPQTSEEDFWALKDVSFEVKQGEVVGIIGRNGAGKSTLLKILSRITEPTKGRITLRGRVASLLEVGTGFHPELTGRENIFLNGAILGMTRAEVRSKFDEIVAFAEVEKFLDTPVKRYSSGMYVRLAFAVAAHLEPEILIVDEVLAVGDAQFQQKCLGRMKTVANDGRTVLFVSHNMSAVTTLCSRAIVLDRGELKCDLSPSAAMEVYMENISDAASQNQTRWTEASGYPGNDRIKVRSVRVSAPGVAANTPLEVGKTMAVECDFWILKAETPVIVDMVIYALDGAPVCESLSAKITSEPTGLGRCLYKAVCTFPQSFLNSGPYRLRLDFLDDAPSQLFQLPEALAFNVIDVAPRSIGWHGRFLGHVRPDCAWSVTRLAEQTQ